MILRLLRKDLLLNWNVVAVATAGSVTLSVLLSYGTGTDRVGGIPLPVVVFSATTYGSLLPTLCAGRDDRYRTGSFDLALPVTRRQAVLARYLLALAVLPVWICLTAVIQWLCWWPAFPAGIFAPATLALALAASVVGMGVSFPLVVGAGIIGLLYGGVGLMVLALAVVSAIRLVPSVRPYLQTLGQARSLFEALHARLGDAWYLAAVVAVLLCLYGASFVIADALYRRKSL